MINNVYVGKGQTANIECQDELLVKLVNPIWGPFNTEDAMKKVAGAIKSKLLYHWHTADGDPLQDGIWVIGWFRNDKVYAKYQANTNTYKIFRIGDII